MNNWAQISKNSRKHGDFAGRSSKEQDAYFEFFSDSDFDFGKLRRRITTLRKWVGRGYVALKSIHIASRHRET